MNKCTVVFWIKSWYRKVASGTAGEIRTASAIQRLGGSRRTKVKASVLRREPRLVRPGGGDVREAGRRVRGSLWTAFATTLQIYDYFRTESTILNVPLGNRNGGGTREG